MYVNIFHVGTNLWLDGGFNVSRASRHFWLHLGKVGFHSQFGGMLVKWDHVHFYGWRSDFLPAQTCRNQDDGRQMFLSSPVLVDSVFFGLISVIPEGTWVVNQAFHLPSVGTDRCNVLFFLFRDPISATTLFLSLSELDVCLIFFLSPGSGFSLLPPPRRCRTHSPLRCLSRVLVRWLFSPLSLFLSLRNRRQASESSARRFHSIQNVTKQHMTPLWRHHGAQNKILHQ